MVVSHDTRENLTRYVVPELAPVGILRVRGEGREAVVYPGSYEEGQAPLRADELVQPGVNSRAGQSTGTPASGMGEL